MTFAKDYVISTCYSWRTSTVLEIGVQYLYGD